MSNEINVKVTIGLSEEFMKWIESSRIFTEKDPIAGISQETLNKISEAGKDGAKAGEKTRKIADMAIREPEKKEEKTDFLDDEAFAKLPFEEMEALLAGETLTEFRVAAFARATEIQFPGKAKALAFHINPKEGFQGIKKDKLQMALFVQRIKDRDWVKVEEDDIAF